MDSLQAYTAKFQVRFADLDFFNHVNNAVYATYVYETLLKFFNSLGIGLATLQANRLTWVVEQLQIRYFHQTRYDDHLRVAVEVVQINESRATFGFEIQHQDGLKPVARGSIAGFFRRPGEISAVALPEPLQKLQAGQAGRTELGIHLTRSQKTENPARYRLYKTVAIHELDPWGQVRPATFLTWIGQAYFDAIRTAGHPVEHMMAQGWYVLQGGHDLQIFASPRHYDPLEIVSWICEMGKVRGAWIHEIRHRKTGELFARDYSLGIFADLQGKIIPYPGQIVDEVIHGTNLQNQSEEES